MMMVASCLAKRHEVTVFWDKKEDVKAVEKRFGISFEKIAIQKNIFSPSVNFIKRMRQSRKYDAFVILSDGSIPFVFPAKLFLHIQQPLSQDKKVKIKDKIKLKYISTIFYNSEFTKHLNDSLFPTVKSTVIYPPVSLDIRHKTEDIRKENIIIHVGRFRVTNLISGDYKKQGFMIEAFKKLVDQGLKDWQFYLAASVKEDDKEAFGMLQKSAKGYPIVFYLNKTSDDLFHLYRNAKIYWHASGYGEDLKKYPELAEHFGMTTVEAMSAGVVPIVINAGGQSEIITDGKNGLLWNTRDELLEKTKKAAYDETLWHNLSQQAILRANDFSEEKFIYNIDQLIRL